MLGKIKIYPCHSVLTKLVKKFPLFFLEYIDRGVVKDGEQPFELPFQVQFFEQDPKRALALLNYN
jgi:hypothetical protein